jgi:hypothetical protein
MNKLELKEQAELVINPINVVTQMDFKLRIIDFQTRFRYDIVSGDKEGLSYYYLSQIKSHAIGLTYYPNRTKMKFELWYRKESGLAHKRFDESFDTELELCVFLKQSKFKIK